MGRAASLKTQTTSFWSGAGQQPTTDRRKEASCCRCPVSVFKICSGMSWKSGSAMRLKDAFDEGIEISGLPTSLKKASSSHAAAPERYGRIFEFRHCKT
ncbi:hypothetical protein DH2020_024207 [Rehmannia glutinosa]|uniref:Uncharacterized protein n=1 Tax=Rehmannia glutinosa TaxID=99300 RepID=A0ABR0W9X9_REHGL